ncbi:hypothetical protein MMC25_006510 [Agyrium rufum]|nr:hypothetical protein [Agyrium rufum]
MDGLPPPPPYSPNDPLTPTTSNSAASLDSAQMVTIPIRTSIRGGEVQPTPDEQPHRDEFPPSSAAEYFEERPAQSRIPLPVVTYGDTISTETQRESLSLPKDLASRDVTNEDWHTFLNYLFAAIHGNASGTLDEDHKILTLEEIDKRSDAFDSVISEWNEGFFEDRFIMVTFRFRPSPFGEEFTVPGNDSSGVPAQQFKIDPNSSISAAQQHIQLAHHMHMLGMQTQASEQHSRAQDQHRQAHDQHGVSQPRGYSDASGGSYRSSDRVFQGLVDQSHAGPFQDDNEYHHYHHHHHHHQRRVTDHEEGRGSRGDFRGGRGPGRWSNDGGGRGRGSGRGQGRWSDENRRGSRRRSSHSSRSSSHVSSASSTYQSTSDSDHDSKRMRTRGGEVHDGSGGRRHQRRESRQRQGQAQRMRSSSTSSSSSNSSESSLDSIESHDYRDKDINDVRAALAGFRLDVMDKKDIPIAVRQLRKDIRAQQSAFRKGTAFPTDTNLDKTQRRAQQKELKKEIKSAMREARDAWKVGRRERKMAKREKRKIRRAAKKERKRERRAEKRERKGEKRERKREGKRVATSTPSVFFGPSMPPHILANDMLPSYTGHERNSRGFEPDVKANIPYSPLPSEHPAHCDEAEEAHYAAKLAAEQNWLQGAALTPYQPQQAALYGADDNHTSNNNHPPPYVDDINDAHGVNFTEHDLEEQAALHEKLAEELEEQQEKDAKRLEKEAEMREAEAEKRAEQLEREAERREAEFEREAERLESQGEKEVERMEREEEREAERRERDAERGLVGGPTTNVAGGPPPSGIPRLSLGSGVTAQQRSRANDQRQGLLAGLSQQRTAAALRANLQRQVAGEQRRVALERAAAQRSVALERARVQREQALTRSGALREEARRLRSEARSCGKRRVESGGGGESGPFGRESGPFGRESGLFGGDSSGRGGGVRSGGGEYNSTAHGDGYGNRVGQMGEDFGRYMGRWGENFGRQMEDFGRQMERKFS